MSDIITAPMIMAVVAGCPAALANLDDVSRGKPLAVFTARPELLHQLLLLGIKNQSVEAGVDLEGLAAKNGCWRGVVICGATDKRQHTAQSEHYPHRSAPPHSNAATLTAPSAEGKRASRRGERPGLTT